MTAEEIRKRRDEAIDNFSDAPKTVEQYHGEIAFWLGVFLPEIAAQLAEWNERNARAEKKAMEIADRSMGLIERSEKSMDELDDKKKKRDASLV
jgi:hypothetical protein